MGISDEESEVLLQEIGENLSANDLWCLDTGESNHMRSQRKLIHVLDEWEKGTVGFGDGSIIYYEGKGSILVR